MSVLSNLLLDDEHFSFQNIKDFEKYKEFELELRKYGDRSLIFQAGKRIEDMTFFKKPKVIKSANTQVKLNFGFLLESKDKRTRNIVFGTKSKYFKKTTKEGFEEAVRLKRNTKIEKSKYISVFQEKYDNQEDENFYNENFPTLAYLDMVEHKEFLANASEKELELAQKYGTFKTMDNYYVETPTMRESYKTIERGMKYSSNDFKSKVDSYLSTAVFYTKKRQTQYVTEMVSFFTELDYYKMDEFKDISHKEMLKLIYQALDEANFPRPTEVIFSKGIQLVWRTSAVPLYKKTSWNLVQSKINSILKHLGADSAVTTDVTRYLRAFSSVHSGTGKQIFAYSYTDDRYLFDDFLMKVCPEEYQGLKERQQQAIEKTNKRIASGLKVLKGFGDGKIESKKIGSEQSMANHIHQAYLQDVLKLISIRNYQMIGTREIVCFLVRYWSLCTTDSKLKAINYMKDVFYSLDINGSYTFDDILAHTRSAETAHERWKKDVMKGYRYSSKKLIELLNITLEEQKQLSKIMCPEEAARRGRERDKLKKQEKRRNKGMKLQGESKKEKIEAIKAVLLENPKATVKFISEKTGIKLKTVEAYVPKIRKEI